MRNIEYVYMLYYKNWRQASNKVYINKPSKSVLKSRDAWIYKKFKLTEVKEWNI